MNKISSVLFALAAEFEKYQRVDMAELRPYVPGEDLKGVSISEADLKAGSPKPGDMVARNPKNYDDTWLVAKEYFEDNFDLAEADH